MSVSNSQFTIMAVSREIGWADKNHHIKVRCLSMHLVRRCEYTPHLPLPQPEEVGEGCGRAGLEQDKHNESSVNCGRAESN